MRGCELRVGTVTAIDAKRYTARVRFDDRRDMTGLPLISDWLQVVQRPGTALNIKPDGAHSQGAAGAQVEDHSHEESVSALWMPKINDQVLTIYEGVANGRGYIVGGVMTWR